MKLEIEYVLSEERDPYYIVKDDNGNKFEESSHWEALKIVKGYINAEVYDETYDVTYQMVGQEIETMNLPSYLEDYKDRYIRTFNGNNKEEPLKYHLEEELVEKK
jgi:hypothetical protein